MKQFYLCLAFICISIFTYAQQLKVFNDTTLLQPVEVNGVKASDKNPFAKTNLSKTDIATQNIGQDLPFILNATPSVVVNSDAGAGVGYTGIRIRGTDATRINVTLNGIPYNDAEGLGTFFVDVPDIASSAGSIQIQRGVGTSANGAGSFGASINISTNEINAKKNIELNSTAGSYETFKNTFTYNSGIFKKHFLIDARASNIRSHGFIDRASSRLKSYYLSTAYIDEKNSVRLNIFTGKERTYQAYFGISEADLKINRRLNSAGTEKPGEPYSNEVDDYMQNHYQLFYNHAFSANLKSSVAVFFTKGKGYYEQYKTDQKLLNYSINSSTKTDLIRRLWLDNNFYGTVFSLIYNKYNTQIAFGAGANQYDGKHFGQIIWAEKQIEVPTNYRWYNKKSKKTDLSAYTKLTQKLNKNFELFADIQVRNIGYINNGYRKTPDIMVDKNYTFFNPKAGVTFSVDNVKMYASFARAVKEPNRDDFEANPNQQPKPEKLNDIETGIEYKNNQYQFWANFYYMFYKDQLVQTGKINDVGASTRLNVDNSYRAGVELNASSQISKKIALSANLTLSSNKIKNFTEFIFDYDNNINVAKQYSRTDISFSPNVISNISLDITPVKNLVFNLTGKYVSDQYLDNTSNKSRRLHDFYTQNVKATYTLKAKQFSEVKFFVQGINIFGKKYEPNGYSFSYISGGDTYTENFYYPMATANFMFGVSIGIN